MIYVEDKILALLIQLPPSMGIVEGMTCLGDIIPELDKRLCVTSSIHSFLLDAKKINLQ